MIVKNPIYTTLVIFTYIHHGFSAEKGERLLAELELADLELADDCEDLANGLKTALLEQHFADKIIAEKAHGHLLRVESKNLKTYDYIPADIEGNWTYLVKPGDGLLPEEDWNTLVSYHNANEELVSVMKVPCLNNSDGCVFTKGEYQAIMRRSMDMDLLKGTWFSWQHVFSSNPERYATILPLLKKAATLNDNNEDVARYWEYLSDFPGGYSNAKQFWVEIKPLYVKLHEFVKRRLYNFYELNDTSSEIAVYLLGDNFGKDWSSKADKILPHPQLHYDVESFLKYKDLQEIYLLAENLTDSISLGKLGEEFWANSKFNMSFCEPQILSFCSQEYSEVYDCDKSSWVTYLDAHEAVFTVALRNQDYASLMRQNLRYSAVDEAVITLGSLLAIESLPHHGIVNKDVFNDTSEDDPATMTKLLLTALRVLPKLPYYLAADEWRLKELGTPSENVAVSWWQFRNEYQLVKGVSGGETDFLRDKYITSNKPYLSKFLGTILAFQFMEYYRGQLTDPEASLAMEIGNDANFLSMIKERPTTNWVYLVMLNYGFDLSPLALLQYFKPLEKYLENAPLEQAKIATTTTTTTTTSKPVTTSISNSHDDGAVKIGQNLNQSAKAEGILNDDPKTNISDTSNSVTEANSTGNVTIYAGVGLLCFVCVLLLAVYGYKHIKKRRRTNNRRFAA